MIDKTHSEHKRSAFGLIASKGAQHRDVEASCEAVFQASKSELKPTLPNKPRGIPRVNDRPCYERHLVW